jgi:NADP-dependent 3-hydroxy acid dehydrogenase YdfG
MGGGAEPRSLFIREGARVAMTGRDASRFDEVRAELGDAALIVAADVRSPTNMETVSRCIGETFGGLDILFANVGIA